MDSRDLSWGRLPKQFSYAHQKEEHDLIHEWREWNHDLRIGDNLVNNSNNTESIGLGKRVVIKCSLEMDRICKRLEEIRNE